jgi:hypothetical protein
MTKPVVAFLLLALTVPLHADFSSVASAIDGHRGVKRIWIPFLGLARMVAWVASPKGVHDFQLATFEGADRLDPRELQQIMAEKAGPGFKPLVRTWSRRSKEWSFIYARPRPNGTRIELMILAHDDDDTVLIRVEVDTKIIARELNSPKTVARVAMK